MKKILVVGGGFGGLHAALSAKREGGDDLEVVLLSRDPSMEIRPRLYEANPLGMTADLITPLRTAGIAFRQAEAVAVDLDRREVRTTAGVESYDRLVVATGSVNRHLDVPGSSAAYTVDTAAAAAAFEERLRTLAQTPAPAIVVLGAGFVGLEVVLELRSRLGALGAKAPGDARIILVDRAETVGPELGAGPRQVIEDALAQGGVELRLGVRVNRIEPDAVVLEDGARLPADAVVSCIGLVAAPFAAKVPGIRDALGRLVLDAQLRAPDAPDVYVAGDAGVADTSPGRPTLVACQHAVGMGRFAGANAARDLLGRALLDYSQPKYVTCLDLGDAGAVYTEGWERDVVLTGADAKGLKQQINTLWIYPPVGDRDAVLAAGDPGVPVVA